MKKYLALTVALFIGTASQANNFAPCGNTEYAYVGDTQEKSAAPPVQKMEYIYQFDPSVPPVILHIENGMVTAIN